MEAGKAAGMEADFGMAGTDFEVLLPAARSLYRNHTPAGIVQDIL